MKADRPSRTARLVTFGRALADVGISHVIDFSDPTARVFLGEKQKRRLAAIERAARQAKRSSKVEMARGMADIMALRTAAIDAAARDAIARGARQVVILGAGYDGRAWRMRELRDIRVFEIDHPATQNEKRSHLAELPPAIGVVTFVPIDFERDSLDKVLERAGHDRSAPTCWIWEGVVMYLTHESVRATLASIAGRSAPGSTLIVNYHTGARRLFARLILRLIGEPHISAWTPAEMASDLRAAGFTVREDSSTAEWNAWYAEGRSGVGRVIYMRIAVASR